MSTKLGAASCGLLSLLFAQHAAAQDITLRGTTTELTVTGKLLSYENNTYEVELPILGAIRVDGLIVTCEGEACPDQSSTSSAALSVRGEDHLARQYLSVLSNSLATELGYSAAALPDSPVYSIGPKSEVSVKLESDASFAFTGEGYPAETLFISRDEVDASGIQLVNADGSASSAPLTQKVVGMDAAVVATSPRNPLRAISLETLARIFAGEVTDWSEIGLSPGPIHLVAEGADSPATQKFVGSVLDRYGKELSANITNVETVAAFDEVIASDPLAIGVGSFSQVSESTVLTLQDSCGVQVTPTAFTLKTEEYPLSQRIFAYSAANTSSDVFNRLVEISDLEETQKGLDETGIVGLNIASQTPDNQGLRFQSAIMADDVDVRLDDLRELSQLLGLADRLSVTFRFETGRATPDQRALADIERLASLITLGEFKNKEILLIGFTDAVGDAQTNQLLAARRASAIEAKLRETLPSGATVGTQIRAIGLGEAAPVNCNDSLQGQERNRRVEVWVKDIVRTAALSE